MLPIKYYEESHTIFIIRETGIFLYNILTKFTELTKDENLCVEIIEAILDPLINLRGKDGNINTTDMIVNDEDLVKTVMPCMKITNDILTMCIESNKRSRMAYYILLKYRYENKIWQVWNLVVNNPDFLTVLNSGLNISNFARLSSMDIPQSDATATDLPYNVHTIHFYNLIMACITRRYFKHVNQCTEMHHQLWYKLGDRAPAEVVLENHDLKYGDQVIMIQTLPIIYVIKSRYKADDEYFNELCMKFFHKSCEHTIRLLYQYRDGLSGQSIEFIAELAANSIQRILALNKVLNRDRALLAFQILIFVLKGFVNDQSDENSKEKKTSNTQLVLQAPNLLSTLILGINEMIKNYNFTWKECIESTTIVSLLLVLLDNPNLNARVSSLLTDWRPRVL